MSDPDDLDPDDTATIQLILDASALCAYGQNETVGEIIGLTGEQPGAVVATTTAALAEALARGADAVLLDVLRTLPDCVVVTSTVGWKPLGAFMDMTRPSTTALHDLADSDLALLAVMTDASVLTDQPRRYTDISPLVVTIELEEPWSD